jgi:hypothetical protein
VRTIGWIGPEQTILDGVAKRPPKDSLIRALGTHVEGPVEPIVYET